MISKIDNCLCGRYLVPARQSVLLAIEKANATVHCYLISKNI